MANDHDDNIINEKNCLDTLYYSNEILTNDLIIRVLNTILGEISDPFFLNGQFKYFIELLTFLSKDKDFKRNEINYMLDEISQFDGDIESLMRITFRNLDCDSSKAHKLFIICYFRTEFEMNFAERISYENPKYAINKAMGFDDWTIFLECYKDGGRFILF